MHNLRKYGEAPYSIAVIHGGPGGPGQTAPVARELSKKQGVLEPIQTEKSVEGQIKELHCILNEYSTLPVTLVGHSWGAMLSILFTARYPRMVKKLVLISSGLLEEKYAYQIRENRIRSMSIKQIEELEAAINKLDDPKFLNKNSVFMTVASTALKVDSFDPDISKNEIIEAEYDTYDKVWKEGQMLRRENAFIESAKKITCPVICIHGDSDPHPAETVKGTLSRNVWNLKFILLEKCGHYPWIERKAKRKFYSYLKKEVKSVF